MIHLKQLTKRSVIKPREKIKKFQAHQAEFYYKKKKNENVLKLRRIN